jgi:hypothetical protein
MRAYVGSPPTSHTHNKNLHANPLFLISKATQIGGKDIVYFYEIAATSF